MHPDFNHDIFISYSSVDKRTAIHICQILEDNGLKCWIAPRDIIAGSDYAKLLESAILHAKAFVVICSKDSMKSRWVIGELNIAFNEGKKIIPIRIDDSELEGSFRLMINQLHIIPHEDSLIKDTVAALKSAGFGDTEHKHHSITWRFLLASILFISISAFILCLFIFPVKEGKISHEDISVTETDTTITLSIKDHSLKLILIEPGSFMMGTDDSFEQDPKPMHAVTISQKYYLSETEVTQGLWKTVMGHLPCRYSGTERPVEGVSWNDCMDFIATLSELSGRAFRFPTEAEWEYAAKGGSRQDGFRFSGSDDADEVAWHKRNSGGKSADVKGKTPNRLGLYDMTGNVSEWCQDWYGTYGHESQTDPLRDIIQKEEWPFRIIRGGNYMTENPSRMLNTYRSCNNPSLDALNKNRPDDSYKGTGLRLAL